MTDFARQTNPYDVLPLATTIERLAEVRRIVQVEANALLETSRNLSPTSVEAAELTADCRGSVVVTGVGKAGLVGQKLVATLASTGTPAHFLHPTEAVHGDFGRVREIDLVWALSNSGRSQEVVNIASQLRRQSSGLVSITASDDNPLAAIADVSVVMGTHHEACPHGLAPTTSTTVMMAVGDAVAMLASRIKSFTPQDFAKFHPGGALGRKLAEVDQIMRPIEQCRVASQSVSIRQAMITTSQSGRRTGAVMLVDGDGLLAGVFTDSDLARLLESREESALDDPIWERMTSHPTTIASGSLLQDAQAIISERRISELPVVGKSGVPLGLIDITDLVSLTESNAREKTSSILPLPITRTTVAKND